MNSNDLYKISDYAYFKSQKNIEIDMPDSVGEIGSYAYAEVKNLKCIKLSNNLNIIREFAFCNSGISDITLPSSLKRIGLKAFSGCKNLKRLIIPEGVLDIGNAAFANCENLEEVYLPNSLKKLSSQMFLNCRKLKRIHLPNGITALPDEFFKGCRELDIDLSHITSIGKGTFNNCTSLVKIPDSITEFNSYDFKGCINLEEVHINKNITHLPDHLFDGCVNLKRVIIDGKVSIGEKTFKNCKSLEDIPENISEYGKYSFENCLGLTSITLNNKHIPEGCFRGCVNLNEIKDFNKVLQIDAYGLDNTGFENIDLRHINKISNNIMSNCKKLRSVNLNGHEKIGAYAFYRSPHLKVDLPYSIKEIGKMAFAYNKDTKKLVIPNFVKLISPGAFAYSNYENIECFNNPTYFSFEGKMLIHSLLEELILYASGSKDKAYSLNNYCEQGDLISPINSIGEYAFAGAKYLEELEVPSCVADIEKTAFQDTPNLKTLNIIVIPLMGMINFTIKNHRYLYIDKSLINSKAKKDEPFIPFEVLNFYGDNINISSSCFDSFKCLKEINFKDNKVISIDHNAFHSVPINHVYLPEAINSVGINAFNQDCIVEFSNGLKIKLYNFLRDTSLFYKYALYTLSNVDSYLVEGNGNIVSLSEEDMSKFTKNYDLIANDPTKFMDYLYSLDDFDLKNEKLLHNGILMKLKIENRRKFLAHYNSKDSLLKEVLIFSGLLDKDDTYTHSILDSEEGIEKFYNYVELLRKYNIRDKILYNRVLIHYHDLDELESIFYTNKDLLVSTIEKLKIIVPGDNEVINESLLKNKRLVKFLNYILKYNLKDPFLFQEAILGISDLMVADKFFKTFDNNTKRLIKNSLVIDKNKVSNSIQNLSDLLTLCYITGGLEDDKIVRQRALTFITEKIAMDYDNGNTNYHKISGDDFHRLFNFGNQLRDEFDEEFAIFFLENYKKLYEREIKKSGFIQRSYINFRDISLTSTSDRGIQRHKKVTLQKAINFLAINKFNNVTESEAPLADFIGEWYSEESVWERVKILLEEEKDAPRNIFTKVTLDDDGKQVFDDNPEHDLKEKNFDIFGYEWLPKQEWENFILGKYCNCCAHVNGQGNGIMRASIITDCVQNLVIRDKLGKIIAKSTLYVNREQGYGVFNNVEASLELKKEDLEYVYEAFIRGASEFVKVYNKNNDVKLTRLAIGVGRNRINEQLDSHGHKIVDTLQGLNFSQYSFNLTGYAGDWRGSQRLVLSKSDIDKITNN